MTKNSEILNTEDTVKAYEGDFNIYDGLTTPEKLSLELVPISMRCSILDIGIGLGRTAGPLSAIFGKYVGIDFSPNVIAKAKALFPDTDLREMDARNLEFSDKFDCVMFSFNGIDYSNFVDRELILRQIGNVLRPGGLFIYSTHNLGCRRAIVWRKTFLVKELFSNGRLRSIRLIKNRLNLFWHQGRDRANHLAYLNDPALRFTILTTYVDIPTEVNRLREFGFETVATIGNNKTTAEYNEEDVWVYIVARNGPQGSEMAEAGPINPGR